ncbi:MAG: exonuclease SbcCD subunit D [Vagococcus sp.]
MKFLHTADWHIGRKLNQFSLLEEQRFAFEKMMAVADREHVEAIVIAGDLYDRSVPSVDAVSLFNEMMVEMNLERHYPVLAISGNHDSATRLETGTPWLKEHGIYLHTSLEQSFEPVELGDTQFFLLPYFEPFHARRVFEDDSIRDIQTAMSCVIDRMTGAFKQDMRHVLVGHFFAAGSTKMESETPLEVGGLDSITTDMLDVFDYVALGHLHYKDAIKQHSTVKYSGSLLKYSVSEANQEKGVRVVEFTQDEVKSDFIPLTPLRDVAQVTASFEELTHPDFYKQMNRENYLAISLTDRTIITNALGQLRQIYPNMISLERANGRESLMDTDEQSEESMHQLRPEVILANYYKDVSDSELSSKQKNWLEKAIQAYGKEK